MYPLIYRIQKLSSIFAINQYVIIDMKETDEILTIRVRKSKAKAFRSMLKLFDFVSLETAEEKLNRYILSSPKNTPVSDEDIMKIIKPNFHQEA